MNSIEMCMKTEVAACVPGKSWLKKPRIKKLEGKFEYAEGPLWHPDRYFLFSDTPANKIYQLFPDGALKVFLHNSGLTHTHSKQLSDQIGSNGLALDQHNNLFICQHGNHAVAVLNNKKELHTLVGSYKGMPLNSPNDIALRSDGRIYFTDPPYGLAGQVLHPESFQPQAGIYTYNFKTIELASALLQYPNGIVFSPDERYLYVSTTQPTEKNIVRYTVNRDGSICYDGVLIEENADGIKIDKSGTIYMATKDGILAVSPKGKKLALIALPDTPSNLSWDGGEEILFVTAGSSVYFIEK